MSGEPKEFVYKDLRGARFVESDLSDVVMRAVVVSGMDIDAPWLVHGKPLLVNGVEVTAYVESELDRRFPGRAERRAESPEGLRAAWTAVDTAWAAAIDRAAALPAGSVDVSVAGEWSFAQTLRHLVQAIDIWLGQAVLGLEDAFHPVGLSYTPEEEAVPAPSAEDPAYDDVLAARADRFAMVRDFLATVTEEQLDEGRQNPHNPQHPETVRSCLHVILEEGWEHLRFALRDLEVIESGPHLR